MQFYAHRITLTALRELLKESQTVTNRGMTHAHIVEKKSSSQKMEYNAHVTLMMSNMSRGKYIFIYYNLIRYQFSPLP